MSGCTFWGCPLYWNIPAPIVGYPTLSSQNSLRFVARFSGVYTHDILAASLTFRKGPSSKCWVLDLDSRLGVYYELLVSCSSRNRPDQIMQGSQTHTTSDWRSAIWNWSSPQDGRSNLSPNRLQMIDRDNTPLSVTLNCWDVKKSVGECTDSEPILALRCYKFDTAWELAEFL